MLSKKLIVSGVLVVMALILFLICNPLSWNDGGNRTVVVRSSGKQFVQFAPGLFYAGFFAKETQWPNQISVTYQSPTPDLDLEDNSIEIGYINIQFSDGTRADVKGITQFLLPTSEHEMIEIHNAHNTPQSLVTKRLATFTKECLQSSAQLMTSDKHYGGGRTQMSQDFLDQLKAGVFLASIQEKIYYDSVEKETKRLYVVEIRKNKDGLPLRKASPLNEYGINVADAAVIDTDYEKKVDDKLDKIVDAATKSAVSRQELMTAQQQALTAKAKGEQELVEIEYEQKKVQTREVVTAETKVKVAEQDKLQQRIQAEAAELEARKIKTLADADAYKKRTTIQANGALELKLSAWLDAQKYWAEAFGKYQGNIAPQIQSGFSPAGGNAAVNFMEIMGARAAKDLVLDLKNSK